MEILAAPIFLQLFLDVDVDDLLKAQRFERLLHRGDQLVAAGGEQVAQMGIIVAELLDPPFKLGDPVAGFYFDFDDLGPKACDLGRGKAVVLDPSVSLVFGEELRGDVWQEAIKELSEKLAFALDPGQDDHESLP